MNIENGNVVVIRDGDYVEAVFYRKYYSEIQDFFDEVRMYLDVKKFADPNISYMEIVDGRFKVLDDGEFKNEFPQILNEFELSEKDFFCPTCGAPRFVYFNKGDSYCPKCKVKR